MSAEIVLKPEIRIRASCKDGVCCVEAIIPTAYGDLRLTGCYPLKKAYQAVVAWCQARGILPPASRSGAESTEAGFLGSLSRKARKLTAAVAQAAALAPVIKSVQAIQKNPVLARAVGLTTAVIPGAGSAQIAARAAFGLVQKAQQGVPLALGQLSRLKSLVQMGSPQAANAWRLVQGAHKAIQEKKPIDMLRGLSGTAIQQINEPAQQAAQAVAMKNQILGYLPAHLRPYVDAAIQRIPVVAPVQQAAQFAPLTQAMASRFPGAAAGGVAMDPAAYLAGYYGC